MSEQTCACGENLGTNVECPECLVRLGKCVAALAGIPDPAAYVSRVAATDAMLSEFQLRLAGALIASEGGNGRPDDAIEAIKTCPTIKSVMDLRKDRDALASRVAAMEEVARLYNIYHLFIEFKLDEFRKAMDAKPDADCAPLVTKLNEKLGRAVWAYRQHLAKSALEGGGK